MKLRPITGADRALAHGDRLTRAIGDTVKPRRRTHFKFGKLEVVVVETSGEPTTVYLTNGEQSADLVEATAAELAQAAAAVQQILSNPPIKRKR